MIETTLKQYESLIEILNNAFELSVKCNDAELTKILDRAIEEAEKNRDVYKELIKEQL